MAEELETLDIIRDKVTELQPLYDRMDKTRDLAYGKKYELKGFDDVPLEKVINVTTNWPGVFASAIISDLMGATWQTVIESDGKLSPKQIHIIENFIEDNLAQVDEQLIRRGYVELFTWIANHVCIRSLIGARWFTQLDKDGYKVDCLPVDMRWTPFDFGDHGLNWVAPKTFRSKALIKAKYGKDVDSDETEVIDFWTGEKNEIWIAEELVKTQKNPFGYPPFVIVKPSSGFTLRDKGYIEHDAEDLFFLNRGLYDERSRNMSLEQTLGMDVLWPPMEQESSDEELKPDKRPKTGETKKVKKGEKHVLLPRGDLTKAFLTGRADIQRDLQMGGVNDIDLGNVSQTVSAVWITEQSEIRNKLNKPRLEAMASFRQQSARMLISQYRMITDKAKKSKSEFLIGVQGRKRKYTAQQLGDPDTYTIRNELMSQSKKQEIVNLAMFSAARGQLPLKVRLTDILKADDPDGIMRQLDLEAAKRADPAIGLFEMAIRYAEEAEDLEGDDAEAKKIQSMMLTERGCAIIRQRTQVPQELPEEATVPEAEEKGAGVESLVPLLGGGTPGARGPLPAEEE